MAQKKLEQRLMEFVANGSIDPVSAGWLILVGRKANLLIRNTPEPTEWRRGSSTPGHFFDWMAWQASSHGWEKAYELARSELTNQQVGKWGLGSLCSDLKRWLEEQWDTVPDVLQKLMTAPEWREACSRASAAYWLDLETFQAMKRVGDGHGIPPPLKDGEAQASVHRSWGSAKEGAFGFAVSPHLIVREGKSEAMVHLGSFLPAGHTTNGQSWYGVDDDGNDISGIDESKAGIPHDRLVQLVKVAVKFWDELDQATAAALTATS